VPIFALTSATQLMIAANGRTDGQGVMRLTMANIGPADAIPLSTVYWMLLVDILLYSLLFVYLDLVLPVGPGVKLHWAFPFSPSYWKGRTTTPPDRCALPPAAGEPAEVAEERARVAVDGCSTEHGRDGVRVLGVSKTCGTRSNCSTPASRLFMSEWRRRYPGARAAAVSNVQFGIRESECFGLLGSNGAGKSTAIHVLCGVHAPSSGTVLCADGDGGTALDIRTEIKRAHPPNDGPIMLLTQGPHAAPLCSAGACSHRWASAARTTCCGPTSPAPSTSASSRGCGASAARRSPSRWTTGCGGSTCTAPPSETR
jgi:hypothetical protein